MPPKSAYHAALAKSISASKSSSKASAKNDVPGSAAFEASSADTADEGPVYFWKPDQANGFLGQWYESEWEHEGCTYVTAEMWMMVGKARLFGDEDVAKLMLETTDPKAHKALGRRVRGFDDGVWKANRFRIVEQGNYLKFTKSKDAETLRKMLLATGDRELVEASPMDRIWGVGFGEKNAGKMRHRWGQNLLGKALMDVRRQLMDEDREGAETT